MAEKKRLLILGGTTEALALSQLANAIAGLQVVTSLAGRTETPASPAGILRVGGFGGAEGLSTYLNEQHVDLVIDATHPFAAIMSRNAASACNELKLPRLSVRRPAWEKHPDDNWIEVDDAATASGRLRSVGSRIFLTVGKQQLAAFRGLPDVWFLVRVIDPPTDPLPLVNAMLITGRGPFAVEEEKRLLVLHRIEGLVSRNSGGDATYAKIVAAREVGLPVVMIRRPPSPKGENVETVDEAIAWIKQRL